MVERVEVAAAALEKDSVTAPAAPVVMSSPQGVEAHPQEVPTPSAGLTPPTPILAAAAEIAQPPEPLVLPDAEASSVLALRTSSPCPTCSRAMVLLPPPGPWRRQGRR